MSAPKFDLLIRNVRVVRPHGNAVHEADIAVKDGRVAKVAPAIDATRAKAVYEGKGRLAFPGVVDAHMHCGIYSPLEEDAVSEAACQYKVQKRRRHHADARDRYDC